eukprot:8118060-Lingulodinium_polyedra.AAC.1
MEPAHGGAGPAQRGTATAADAAGEGEGLAVPDSSDDESSLWLVQAGPVTGQEGRESNNEGDEQRGTAEAERG